MATQSFASMDISIDSRQLDSPELKLERLIVAKEIIMKLSERLNDDNFAESFDLSIETSLERLESARSQIMDQKIAIARNITFDRMRDEALDSEMIEISRKLEDIEANNKTTKHKRASSKVCARPPLRILSPDSTPNPNLDSSLDEICLFDKKPRAETRLTPGRMMTRSARKLKLERHDDIDLSPISPIRRPRVRTTRRKLAL